MWPFFRCRSEDGSEDGSVAGRAPPTILGKSGEFWGILVTCLSKERYYDILYQNGQNLGKNNRQPASYRYFCRCPIYLFLGNLRVKVPEKQHSKYHDVSSTCKKKSAIFAFWRHTVSMELKKITRRDVFPFNWSQPRGSLLEAFIHELGSKSIPWNSSRVDLCETEVNPAWQDTSSLKHIILFEWRSPSPTRFTSNYRIPTSDEYLRPILIDPEISIHFSYFCGKKWWNILMMSYCCCRRSPPALPVCLAKGC